MKQMATFPYNDALLAGDTPLKVLSFWLCFADAA